MFFRGLRFWLLCIISLLTPTLPTPTPPKKTPKHSRGNRSKIQNVASSQWQTTLCCAKELLQEHPDLSSTSFYSQLACVLPAPLAQTPHLSQRVLRKVCVCGGGVIKGVTVWCSVCVWMCAWRRIAAALAERCTYGTAQPSMKSPLFSFKRAYMDF